MGFADLFFTLKKTSKVAASRGVTGTWASGTMRSNSRKQDRSNGLLGWWVLCTRLLPTAFDPILLITTPAWRLDRFPDTKAARWLRGGRVDRPDRSGRGVLFPFSPQCRQGLVARFTKSSQCDSR